MRTSDGPVGVLGRDGHPHKLLTMPSQGVVVSPKAFQRTSSVDTRGDLRTCDGPVSVFGRDWNPHKLLAVPSQGMIVQSLSEGLSASLICTCPG